VGHRGDSSFAGCKITGRTGSYTLKARDGALTPATSNSFRLSSATQTPTLATRAAGLVGMPGVPLLT
jgi:hypothetical protein